MIRRRARRSRRGIPRPVPLLLPEWDGRDDAEITGAAHAPVDEADVPF